MTPADNDPLVIGATVAEASTTWTENVAPGETDWTLSNDEESAATGAPSSFVYKIVSGAPGTPRSAWTLGTSRVWATNIIAFKPSAGGPSAGTDTATAGLTDTMRTVSVSLSIAESG
jgi:hypothetical protein